MKARALTPLLTLVACAPLAGGPSLAPRAIERAADIAPAATQPAVAASVDPVVRTQIGKLVADARAGDAAFSAADRSGALAIAAGRRAKIGSDVWISGEAARSALDIARAASSDALTALDQLRTREIESTGTETGAGVIAMASAQAEVAAIVERQAARMAELSR